MINDVKTKRAHSYRSTSVDKKLLVLVTQDMRFPLAPPVYRYGLEDQSSLSSDVCLLWP